MAAAIFPFLVAIIRGVKPYCVRDTYIQGISNNRVQLVIYLEARSAGIFHPTLRLIFPSLHFQKCTCTQKIVLKYWNIISPLEEPAIILHRVLNAVYPHKGTALYIVW